MASFLFGLYTHQYAQHGTIELPMFNSLFSIIPSLELIARAGGGGSSSSGGGGGGAEFLILLGAVPSHYLGKLIKKFFSRKLELIISATFASLVSIILLIIGFMLGGFFSIYVASVITIGIWIGWSTAFFGLWERLANRIKKTRQTIAKASQSDASWNEASLLDYARQCFLRYQEDWSQFNLASITTYTTRDYAKHSALLLQALKELGRTNRMSNVRIGGAAIIDAVDDTSAANKDTYTVLFEATAKDQLIDTDGSVLYTDNSSFVEAWTFVRSETTWLLADIAQQTADKRQANQSLIQFAQQNGLYYSLDMGWLLIPKRGVLLGSGRFGVSDINNHTIGYYNGLLFQLYTYNPNPKNSAANMLIVQLTLPRSYEGIVVRRKTKVFPFLKAFSGMPKNYKKYTYEWPDFNNRYEVYATNADRLASFELINPGFMAYLYDNDPGFAIEVADTTLFMVKPITANQALSADAYSKIMTIALKAFKELRL